MPRATSYICERSAEYALVPKLAHALRQKFEWVTPIYPWISREGSNISLELHEVKSFKVLGLYARRPKLYSSNDQNIKVKISEQIVYSAQKSLELGIPAVAGCPLARNFFDLGSCDDFLWINMSKISIDDIDLVIELGPDHKASEAFDKFLIPTCDEIASLVEASSELFNIESFIRAIKEIKMAGTGYDSYIPMAFMGGYKPVYFLVGELKC